ncbi:chloroplast heat shock protein 70-1 [Perilla frutescens var. hirtella]|nr:chloroplast heat shock protein 70-1 [Perilla frutescens var. hirtella]
MSENLEITTIGIKSHLSSDMADDALLKKLQESQERMYQTLQIDIMKRDVAEMKLQDQISEIYTGMSSNLERLSNILAAIQLQLMGDSKGNEITVEDSILGDPPSGFGFGSEIKGNDKNDDDDYLDNIALIVEDAGKPTIGTNAEGQRAMPSVVTQTKNGDRLVVQIVKKQTIINHENTFINDDDSKLVSYNFVKDKNRNVKLECRAIGKQFAIEEISAQVLRNLADDVSRFLNDKVTREVVTVPTYFNDYQRTTIKDAGHISFLEVLRIINEPTTALLVYGFKKNSNKTILVVDLGGGTFDVSLIEVGDGVFEALLTSGVIHLGGDDLVKRIVDWLATNGPKHIMTTLTRAKFEELCSDLLDKLKNPLQNSLMDVNLSFSNLNEVILVGGSTCILVVQQFVKKLTGNDPNVIVNPDEVIALGAVVVVVQVGVLARDVSNIVLLDVTPLAFGLETLGKVMTRIIPRNNTTLPALKSEVFSTTVDGQINVEINIDVKFDIDAIGILSITAIDKGIGKKQDITISSASTFSNDKNDNNGGGSESVDKEVLELSIDMHGDFSATKSNLDQSDSVNSEETTRSNDSLAAISSDFYLVNESDDAINFGVILQVNEEILMNDKTKLEDFGADNAISIAAILLSQDGLKNRRVNQLVKHGQRNRQKQSKDWFVVRVNTEDIIFHQKACSTVQALVDELQKKDRSVNGRDNIKVISNFAGTPEIIRTMIVYAIDKVGHSDVLPSESSSYTAIKNELQSRIAQLKREFSVTDVVYDYEKLAERITKPSTWYYNPHKIL